MRRSYPPEPFYDRPIEADAVILKEFEERSREDSPAEPPRLPVVEELRPPRESSKKPRLGMKQSDTTTLRRAIIVVLNAQKRSTASVVSRGLPKDFPEHLKARVGRELAAMAREGLLVVDKVQGRKLMTLYSVREYRLGGRLVSLRYLHRCKANQHNLSLVTIRRRLLRGMSPEDALAVPPSSKGKLDEAIREHCEEEDDMSKIFGGPPPKKKPWRR